MGLLAQLLDQLLLFRSLEDSGEHVRHTLVALISAQVVGKHTCTAYKHKKQQDDLRRQHRQPVFCFFYGSAIVFIIFNSIQMGR